MRKQFSLFMISDFCRDFVSWSPDCSTGSIHSVFEVVVHFVLSLCFVTNSVCGGMNAHKRFWECSEVGVGFLIFFVWGCISILMVGSTAM